MTPQFNKFFLVKSPPLYSTSYGRIKKQAFNFLKIINSKTKRRPYIKSKYFSNQKVFTNLFLNHLFKKNYADRKRRLKFLPCAIELIQETTFEPDIRKDFRARIKYYRFYGRIKENKKFVVQIKETSRGSKYFISVFPTQ